MLQPLMLPSNEHPQLLEAHVQAHAPTNHDERDYDSHSGESAGLALGPGWDAGSENPGLALVQRVIHGVMSKPLREHLMVPPEDHARLRMLDDWERALRWARQQRGGSDAEDGDAHTGDELGSPAACPSKAAWPRSSRPPAVEQSARSAGAGGLGGGWLEQQQERAEEEEVEGEGEEDPFPCIHEDAYDSYAGSEDQVHDTWAAPTEARPATEATYAPAPDASVSHHVRPRKLPPRPPVASGAAPSSLPAVARHGGRTAAHTLPGRGTSPQSHRNSMRPAYPNAGAALLHHRGLGPAPSAGSPDDSSASVTAYHSSEARAAPLPGVGARAAASGAPDTSISAGGQQGGHAGEVGVMHVGMPVAGQLPQQGHYPEQQRQETQQHPLQQFPQHSLQQQQQQQLPQQQQQHRPHSAYHLHTASQQGTPSLQAPPQQQQLHPLYALPRSGAPPPASYQPHATHYLQPASQPQLQPTAQHQGQSLQAPQYAAPHAPGVRGAATADAISGADAPMGSSAPVGSSAEGDAGEGEGDGGGSGGRRYRGVQYVQDKRKWRAAIKTGNVKRHLGYYTNPESAARAYDRAALLMHTSSSDVARFLNFPASDYTPGSESLARIEAEMAAARDSRPRRAPARKPARSKHTSDPSAEVVAAAAAAAAVLESHLGALDHMYGAVPGEGVHDLYGLAPPLGGYLQQVLGAGGDGTDVADAGPGGAGGVEGGHGIPGELTSLLQPAVGGGELQMRDSLIEAVAAAVNAVDMEDRAAAAAASSAEALQRLSDANGNAMALEAAAAAAAAVVAALEQGQGGEGMGGGAEGAAGDTQLGTPNSHMPQSQSQEEQQGLLHRGLGHERPRSLSEAAAGFLHAGAGLVHSRPPVFGPPMQQQQQPPPHASMQHGNQDLVKVDGCMGVYWARRTARYRVYCSLDAGAGQKKKVKVGEFGSVEEAARAYDGFVLSTRGATARINYPLEQYLHLLPSATAAATAVEEQGLHQHGGPQPQPVPHSHHHLFPGTSQPHHLTSQQQHQPHQQQAQVYQPGMEAAGHGVPHNSGHAGGPGEVQAQGGWHVGPHGTGFGPPPPYSQPPQHLNGWQPGFKRAAEGGAQGGPHAVSAYKRRATTARNNATGAGPEGEGEAAAEAAAATAAFEPDAFLFGPGELSMHPSNAHLCCPPSPLVPVPSGHHHAAPNPLAGAAPGPTPAAGGPFQGSMAAGGPAGTGFAAMPLGPSGAPTGPSSLQQQPSVALGAGAGAGGSGMQRLGSAGGLSSASQPVQPMITEYQLRPVYHAHPLARAHAPHGPHGMLHRAGSRMSEAQALPGLYGAPALPPPQPESAAAHAYRQWSQLGDVEEDY